MTVAVATLGCDRKDAGGISFVWPTLFEAGRRLFAVLQLRDCGLRRGWCVWCWWRSRVDTAKRFPARVCILMMFGRGGQLQVFSGAAYPSSIRIRRDWPASSAHAQHVYRVRHGVWTGGSAIFFLLTLALIPPKDIIPKLLEVNRDAVCGLVHGRGVHKSAQYIFGEKRRWEEFGTTLVECEHANIGYTMISRKLFEAVRFRYGRSIYPDGRDNMTSDDPAFHLDCFLKFGQWPVVRMDVVGQHVGDLKQGDTSQF